MPIVVYAVDRSSADALGARLSVNHLRSAMPCAAPVTTRKWSRARRITVRSDLKPPVGESTGVYTTRPIATSIWRTQTFWTESRAPAPTMSKIANEERSKMPADSRMARCSALMMGLHQRASHSLGRACTPYVSTSGALQPYHCARSQPASSKNSASCAFCHSYIGVLRSGRSDRYCSAGCTMP